MREREILSRMQMRDLSSRRVETVLPELRRTRIFWLNNNKANFKNRQLEWRGRGGGGGAMLFPGLEFEFCFFSLAMSAIAIVNCDSLHKRERGEGISAK